MNDLFAQITPVGFAVALSPMPIAALLLMLLSKRAKINSIGFLIGWTLGLAFLVTVVSSLISGSGSSSLHPLRNIINGALGVFLILFALKEWRGRPRKNRKPHMPKWMAAISSFSPIKAFGVGFLLATVNFKNTPMGIAAANIMSRGSEVEQLPLLVYYLLLGSSTITIPVLGFLLFGSHIQKTLAGVKEWLVNHNNVIMFVLFLILGVMLVYKAFNG